MSQAYRAPRKRGRVGLAMLLGLVAALGLVLFPGSAAAKGKKKNKNVTVMTRNLYLGSDLTQALVEGLKLGTPAGHPDTYANAVGQVLQNVNATDFGKRAISLSQEISKKRPDLVGLQEAALWRVQIPTDATPLNPNGGQADTVTFDFLQQLLDQLNKKAKSKAACRKQGISPSSPKCYRGYRLVVSQNEFDFESFADFDNNPGPDGKTCDITDVANCPNPGTGSDSWTWGNDDTGNEFGEPPTPPFPPDSNFDQSPFDGTGTDPTPGDNGLPGSDCPDNNPSASPVPPFPAAFGQTHNNVCLFHGIDMDGRLTMRDAIIARKGAGVKTSNPSSGHFDTYLQYSFAGIPVPVLRGFNQVDARVRGHKFHFVNTHLEAFDSQATGNPTNKGPMTRGSVRNAQAQQLIAQALQGPGPVILVGDLNSNVPGVQPGDEQAYQALLANGFLERTSNPASCCNDDQLLSNPNPVGFDHQVDHIMTHTPGITLKKAFETTKYQSGLWSSDHHGVGAILTFFGNKKK